MILIGSESYYIDVDTLNDELNNDSELGAGFTEDSKTTTYKDDTGHVSGITLEVNKIHKPKEVDGFKYDLYMSMIRTVMEVPMEREDPGMPFNLNDAPINFTIAFNTLLYKKILKAI